ncbi:unnamed protein product [Diamesa serratosioi]
MEKSEEETENQEISIAAGNILENMPKNMLYCPFCADGYMFEFTMKDHLKRHHTEEIRNLTKDTESLKDQNCSCCYCGAVFYQAGLIPKHINTAHGRVLLDQWFNMNGNFQKYDFGKENEPSVRLANCSPGLSDLFNGLDTCDSIKRVKRSDSVNSSSLAIPRSILKKTDFSGRIILTPESASIRRTINSLKRTASARRELRFDLPPIPLSPEESKLTLPPSPAGKKPKNRQFLRWNIFSYRKSPPPINRRSPVKRKIKAKSCKYSNKSANQIITSTPIHGLDDHESCMDEVDNTIGSNWKTALKSNFKPLFLTAERYQCNYCKLKFTTNPDLIIHQKDNHSKLTLNPPYRCGQCGTKFYRNSYLVRHCHFSHTPVKLMQETPTKI